MTNTAVPLLDQLYAHNRVAITADLEIGSGRFLQPTGFPDIDACLYRDKAGRRWCLVESEQSMANRLEAVCMKSPGVWVDELAGLPLVAVKSKKGDLLATNLTEPHRIASSYVLDGKRDGTNAELKTTIASKVGLGGGGDFWPLDKRADLEKLIFALDPAALLHGFQFVQWKFVGLRQVRLLHARLEAELAEESEVHYGMVKWDAIEPENTREERANKGQSISAKSRVVPKTIIATFELDILGLKSLALHEDQKKFLLGLALWKVGAFLANQPSFDPRSRQTLSSLHLRADCYLRSGGIAWTAMPVPSTNGSGVIMAEDLMGTLPGGFKQPANGVAQAEHLDFVRLVGHMLDGNAGQEKPKAGNTGAGSIYEGPLVTVVYEPKPKQERGKARGTASQEPPNPEQSSDQSG